MATRIEPVPDWGKNRSCRDRQHNPPSMIVIPQGQQLVHTCPSCGRTVTVRPTEVYC